MESKAPSKIASLWKATEPLINRGRFIIGKVIIFLAVMPPMLAILGFLMAAYLVTMQQILSWLKDGVWHPVPVSHILLWLETMQDIPVSRSDVLHLKVDWVGLQKIINWFLDMPLSVGFLCAGWITFMVLVKVSNIYMKN